MDAIGSTPAQGHLVEAIRAFRSFCLRILQCLSFGVYASVLVSLKSVLGDGRHRLLEVHLEDAAAICFRNRDCVVTDPDAFASHW